MINIALARRREKGKHRTRGGGGGLEPTVSVRCVRIRSLVYFLVQQIETDNPGYTAATNSDGRRQ